MSQAVMNRKPTIDWLTAISIAAIAISLTVGLHEGVHALTCVTVGGDLLEYSALYESCDSPTQLQAKLVAGSAPVFNLAAGTVLWIIFRRSKRRASETQFFLWLLMVMNWCYGAGYFMFSGIANIGDWAVVASGWEPGWIWRTLMTVTGVLCFFFVVRVALKEFGEIVGGEADEQIRRANKLFAVSYVTAFTVVLMAGFFCPYGLLSLPVTAGLFAVLGALSPLLWMTRWFQTEHFAKPAKEPLEIRRQWQWILASLAVVSFYVFILGRTLYF